MLETNSSELENTLRIYKEDIREADRKDAKLVKGQRGCWSYLYIFLATRWGKVISTRITTEAGPVFLCVCTLNKKLKKKYNNSEYGQLNL